MDLTDSPMGMLELRNFAAVLVLGTVIGLVHLFMLAVVVAGETDRSRARLALIVLLPPFTLHLAWARGRRGLVVAWLVVAILYAVVLAAALTGQSLW